MKLLVLFIFALNINAKTLVLIGGGKRPVEALKYFVDQKIPNKKIVVMPWGTSYPMESFEAIKSELLSIGANQDEIICLCDEYLTDQDIKNIKASGAIYFPGGNQNLIMEKIFKYNLKSVIQDLYNKNIPIAGTSAGTAIQSDPMLTGNLSDTAEGLGLLKGYIVDQHFHKRNREQRLIGALKNNPNYSGIGIDEDMSLIVTDDVNFSAVGPSIVSIYTLVSDNQYNRLDL